MNGNPTNGDNTEDTSAPTVEVNTQISNKEEQQEEAIKSEPQTAAQQQQQLTYTPITTTPAVAVSAVQRSDYGCFLRCRGLPFTASDSDVRSFFTGFNVVDVSFSNGADGKPSGEVYVQFATREEAAKAQLKDRQTMGSRYVEVFQVSDIEMDQLMRRMQVKKTFSAKGFVRLRGLPYSCSKADVQNFFRGLTVEEVVFGNSAGPGEGQRPSGEGMVKFGTAEEGDSALRLNGQHMGSRYVEIFKSDGNSFEQFKNRAQNNIVALKSLVADPWGTTGYDTQGSGFYGGGYGSGYSQRGGRGRGSGTYEQSNRYSPYPNYGYGTARGGAYAVGRGGGQGQGGDYSSGGYSDAAYGYGYSSSGYGSGGYDGIVGQNKIYMRGLPFRISVTDIERFFAPLVCVEIKLGTMPDGRSSGDGIVEFQSPADARQALAKDRDSIGNRYIELFPTQSAKIPGHVTYDSIGGKGGSGSGQRSGPSIPTPAQQYAQAVQQQVAAYASGNAYQPTQHQYGQYATADYSSNYYGSYGTSGQQDASGQQQPKADYNWPASHSQY